MRQGADADVVLAMSWVMVFLTKTQGGITEISKKGWVFLHEEFTVKFLDGCVLIGAGTLLMVL